MDLTTEFICKQSLHLACIPGFLSYACLFSFAVKVRPLLPIIRAFLGLVAVELQLKSRQIEQRKTAPIE